MESKSRNITPRVKAEALEQRDLEELARALRLHLDRAERDRRRLRELVDRMYRNLNQEAMGSPVEGKEWEWCRIHCREILREILYA